MSYARQGRKINGILAEDPLAKPLPGARDAAKKRNPARFS
jgi:hypothetical protein